MKESITDRIFEVIDRNELNNNKLAITLGVSRNLISEWKSGKTVPSPKIILKLLFHFPEVDANWLIRGTTNLTDNSQHQTVTGNKNTTQQVRGNKNSVINETAGTYSTAAQKEIDYLKEIIKTKDEQIKLLNKLITN